MRTRATRLALAGAVSGALIVAIAAASLALRAAPWRTPWAAHAPGSPPALGGLAQGAPAPTTTPSATAHTAPSPTRAPTPQPAPTGWRTVLDDEFTAPGIPSHWELYEAPYGSGPGNCAAPSQDTAPGDGYMYLTMAYLTSGDCGKGWYTGGMMISDPWDLPRQAITVRWRIIPSNHPSVVFSHHIIPMAFPDDPNYDWYNAEADYCETEGYTDCWTFLHDGTASDTSPQVYENYQNVDLTQWHTWRFVQANSTLKVYIDNMTAPVWVFRGSPSQFPDAQRRMVLQQECPAAACPPASYAGDTERIQIDWITIQVPG